MRKYNPATESVKKMTRRTNEMGLMKYCHITFKCFLRLIFIVFFKIQLLDDPAPATETTDEAKSTQSWPHQS